MQYIVAALNGGGLALPVQHHFLVSPAQSTCWLQQFVADVGDVAVQAFDSYATHADADRVSRLRVPAPGPSPARASRRAAV